MFVANFDEVRRILNNRGCVKIFSHDDGEIWQNTLKTSDKDGNDLKIPAYLQDVSIDAVVNDADKRNSILLKNLLKQKRKNNIGLQHGKQNY